MKDKTGKQDRVVSRLREISRTTLKNSQEYWTSENRENAAPLPINVGPEVAPLSTEEEDESGR